MVITSLDKLSYQSVLILLLHLLFTTFAHAVFSGDTCRLRDTGAGVLFVIHGVCINLCCSKFPLSRKLKVYRCSEPFYETFSKKAIGQARNGSVTPRDEGFAKQTQVMLLGR